MPDELTTAFAVCSQCDQLKPAAFTGTDHWDCPGTFERVTFVGEPVLDELIARWRARHLEAQECADELADVLEDTDE